MPLEVLNDKARLNSLKQMLHHTSGIHSYTDDPTFPQEAALKRTTDEWIAHFAKMPKMQDFAPGTGWNYSNTAYFILGGVVEKAEGKPLATVLQDRFFGPLGLKHTALDDEGAIVPGRVEGYDATGPSQFRNAALISMTNGSTNVPLSFEKTTGEANPSPRGEFGAPGVASTENPATLRSSALRP